MKLENQRSHRKKNFKVANQEKEQSAATELVKCITLQVVGDKDLEQHSLSLKKGKHVDHIAQAIFLSTTTFIWYK